MQEMKGVEAVHVVLGSGLATVQVRAADNIEAAFVQLPRLINAINALGFQAEPFFGAEDDDSDLGTDSGTSLQKG